MKRIKGERSFYADTERSFPDRERAGRVRPLDADNHPFKSLRALTADVGDFNPDAQLVTGPEFGPMLFM